MIPVTKPFLPPIREYHDLLDGIWRREWLTNNGPLVNELELKLKDYLKVPHLLYLTNGTIALQVAIKALQLRGEVITTPFSYIATASSIAWEGCVPVFADIDPDSWNIDPKCVEKLITPRTTGMVATHVFGNPCDIISLETIAKSHGIPVIYDAAHCFGTKFRGESVFKFGTISTTSFHATKPFHTIEGGAVFTNEAALLQQMALLRNFGYDGPENFAAVGINGKNSEFHAAMGLCNLKYVKDILESRRQQTDWYDSWLSTVQAQRQKIAPEVEYNFAYYPLVLENEEMTKRVQRDLEANRISPRRYFFPSLNTVGLFDSSGLKVSESISRRILCLPLFHSLAKEEIDYISRIVLRSIRN